MTLRGVGDFAHPLELRMGLNYDSSLNDERSSLFVAMLLGVDVGSYLSLTPYRGINSEHQ